MKKQQLFDRFRTRLSDLPLGKYVLEYNNGKRKWSYYTCSSYLYDALNVSDSSYIDKSRLLFLRKWIIDGGIKSNS